MEIWPTLLKHQSGKLSYKESVELFFTINPASPLSDFFKVEDRYSKRKLKAALDAKFEELSHNKEVNDFSSFAVSKNRDQKINLEILPAELRDEYAKQGPRIRKISFLHTKLYSCQSDQERYELAEEIMALVRDRRSTFSRIDTYISSGNDQSKIEETPVQKIRPELKRNYEVEYQIKLLRTQKTKLSKNDRRLPEYQEVCKKLNQLLEKRYEG
jgi:hypothetical protein